MVIHEVLSQKMPSMFFRPKKTPFRPKVIVSVCCLLHFCSRYAEDKEKYVSDVPTNKKRYNLNDTTLF